MLGRSQGGLPPLPAATTGRWSAKGLATLGADPDRIPSIRSRENLFVGPFFDKIKLHQYFLYTHLFVRCLGNLGLRVLIQVYFGVLHSQGFKFWAGNWLFLVPVWVLRPQSYHKSSSWRELLVGGKRQLKAGLPCEVTIEHLEPKGTSTHLKQGEVDLCEGSNFKIEQVEVVVEPTSKSSRVSLRDSPSAKSSIQSS